VRDDFQSQFAALAPGSFSSCEGFEVSLYHGDRGFDLKAITIGDFVEPHLHPSSIVTGSGLRGGPTMLGGNDRADLARATSDSVVWLGVVRGHRSQCVLFAPSPTLAT
jgi:hypothetical protein